MKIFSDERGSVVLFIAFILTIAITGAMLSLMSFIVRDISDLGLVDDTVSKFLVWFFVYGMPILFVVVGITWFLSRLQKRYYETY